MNLAVRAAEILGMLGPPGSSLSEDQSCLRLVGAVCRDEATLAEVKALAVEIEGAGIGTVKLVGDIHGPFDMNAVTLPALANESTISTRSRAGPRTRSPGSIRTCRVQEFWRLPCKKR